MPFVMARLSVAAGKEQKEEIAGKLGRAIECVPGKSEESLMLSIEENCFFFLRGERIPCAYIEVGIFGNEDHEGLGEFARSMTEIFHDTLGIPLQNIYARFEDISSWSVNSMFIDSKRWG